MSRLREFDWKYALLRFAAALLLACGMSLCILCIFFPHQAAAPAVLQCAFLTLLFQGYLHLPFRRKGLFPLLAALGLSAWGALGGGPLHEIIQWIKTLMLSLRGMHEAPLPYAHAARWAVCFLFSLAASLLVWDQAFSLSLASVLGVFSLGYLFGDQEMLLAFAIPAGAGLLLLLHRSEKKRLSALPVALLIALCAFFLMPARTGTVPALSSAAQRIRQFIEDYLFFNDYRSSFSLADMGYQPLESRLGGQAVPRNQSVMEVYTEETVLLRGRTYNQYSGLNWYDTLSSRRYLFTSPRFAALKDNLFDLKRPEGSESIPAQTLRVHMLSASPTTLFVPQRIRTLQMESQRMVGYYNMAGEIFITRNLEPGDQYTLSYLPFSPGDTATRQLIAASARQEDPYFQEISASYLALPDHIQKEIRTLADEITLNAYTPYEQALAIQQYLQANFTYSLNVKTPPEGIDFTAWFLLGEKTGYCTYFATAMTVLCRCAGIPARYVTGYIARPDENGVALVTGKEAHAWTEVYFSGFGWLAFDPTPGASQDGSDSPDEPDSGSRPTPPPAAPSPSPSPAPSLQPETEESPSPSPAPQEEQAPSPTPPPSSPDTPSSENPPSESSFPWWILLMLILALLLFLWFRSTDPCRLAARYPQRAAAIYFAALCLLLRLMGLGKKPQETYHDFAFRAEPFLAGKGFPTLTPLFHDYAAQVYGKHTADTRPFRDAYLACKQKCPLFHRVRFTLLRMIRPIKANQRS